MPGNALTTKPSRAQVLLAFAAVYIIWGSTYLAIRFAIQTLPPFFMAGTRFLVAGSLLYAWMRLRGHAPRPTRTNWVAASVLGALLLLAGNGGVTWAEQTIPSGLAALLVATVPLWVVVIEWLRPSGSRPQPQVAVGVALGLAGLVLLVGPWEIAGTRSVNLLSALVVVLGALGWAAGSVFSRSAPLPKAGQLATGMEMLVGGALLMLVSLVAGEWSRVDLSHASAVSLLALLYLVVFGSLIAFSAYIWLLKAVTPSRAATYAYVNPVVAVFLGWAFAGEPVSGRTLIAAAIIIGAVAIITTSRTRVPAVEPEAMPKATIAGVKGQVRTTRQEARK